MKTVLVVLSMLTVLGCSGDGEQVSQISPIPAPPVEEAPVASVWGMVVTQSGVCIDGATVTVVGGQRLGESIEQTTPCDAWGYGGGFVFKNLTPRVAMTLRATAVGYGTEERTVIPNAEPQRAVLLALAPLP